MTNTEFRDRPGDPAFWDAWDMLPSGARVLCAVSGGADSMCLLQLLHGLEEERGIRVFAAHFEHGLRGEESLRDMAFVENWCREQKIPCLAERGDTRALAEKEHLGLEEAARKLRYAFLERAADHFGCDRIATAHTADDNAETVLLNLVRGSGTKGLGGIPPRRGNIVRPLLETDRAEIEAYLKAQGVPHVEDSSNESLDFSRNRLRREILPLLREMNPALNDALGRTAALLRRDDSFLRGLAEEWLDRNFDGESLPLGELRKLHPAVASRAVKKLCPRSLSAAQTESVLRFAEGTELGYLDLPGLRLRREQGRLYLQTEQPPEIVPRRIEIGKTTDFPELGLRVWIVSIEMIDAILRIRHNGKALDGAIDMEEDFAGHFPVQRLMDRQAPAAAIRGVPAHGQNIHPRIGHDFRIIHVHVQAHCLPVEQRTAVHRHQDGLIRLIVFQLIGESKLVSVIHDAVDPRRDMIGAVLREDGLHGSLQSIVGLAVSKQPVQNGGARDGVCHGQAKQQRAQNGENSRAF